MLLGSTVVNGGDIIFQLIFLVVLIAFAGGIIWAVMSFRKKSRRLDNIEKKLDQLMSDKEK